MSLYDTHHRQLQAQFESEALADRLENLIVKERIGDEDRAFIESREFFFLSTLTPEGGPTVSFKGGEAGFVEVIDERTIRFPSYDGNGMFYSMGNLDRSPAIGILFIDFENPRRIRFHGEARLCEVGSDAHAQLMVEVTLTKMWVNCPRYIPKMARVEASEYTPTSEMLPEEVPQPEWKRMEVFRDVVPGGGEEN